MARGDRKGNRKQRGNARQRVPDLGYYFIVTDTDETEKSYIYGLRDSLPPELQGRIVIKVTKAKTDAMVRACREQAALESQYSEPWIVFDRDQVERFDHIIERANRSGIKVGWSNPCIEVWFEAYFGQMRWHADSVKCCSSFSDTYQKKTGQEYHKANRNIYENLNRFGDEEKAIETAEQKLKGFADEGIDLPSEMCPGTTLHHLVDEIRRKTQTSAINREI